MLPSPHGAPDSVTVARGRCTFKVQTWSGSTAATCGVALVPWNGASGLVRGEGGRVAAAGRLGKTECGEEPTSLLFWIWLRVAGSKEPEYALKSLMLYTLSTPVVSRRERLRAWTSATQDRWLATRDAEEP